MYSTREKLIHFNQLVNPQAVEADLALLHEKNPQSTDFVRFDHAPEKNSEDILFALLDVCEHDEIVRNRREFFAAENENTDKNSGDGGNGTPSEDTGTENPTDGGGNGTPSEDTGTENLTDGEGTPSEETGAENPTDGEGNGTPSEDTGTENPTDGEGNGTPSEDTDTENPTDGEGNDTPLEDTGAETDNVDNSSEEGKGNQPKKPATPKKKKKSTRK